MSDPLVEQIMLALSAHDDPADATNMEHVYRDWLRRLLDRLTALERELAEARAVIDKGLDYMHHSSCGHTWTMRHTACPECFAAARAEVAEAQASLRVAEDAHAHKVMHYEEEVVMMRRVLGERNAELAEERQEHQATLADAAALRQRHAEAVEHAFKGGYVRAFYDDHPEGDPTDEALDAAWLASKAKKGIDA